MCHDKEKKLTMLLWHSYGLLGALLAAYCANMPTNKTTFYEPERKSIIDTAITIIALMNEIDSLPKEERECRGRDSSTKNLVMLMMREKDLTREQAIEAVRNEIHDKTTAFMRMNEGAAEMQRWVEVMARMIEGYATWAKKTSRYQSDTM